MTHQFMFHADDFGGDLQRAFDEATGGHLYFDGSKNYPINSVKVTKPITVTTSSCQFTYAGNDPSTFVLEIATDNVRFDSFRLLIPGGHFTRGIGVISNQGFRCDQIEVISVDQSASTLEGAPGDLFSSGVHGVRLDDLKDARLGSVRCKNFEVALAIRRCSDLMIGGVDVTNYLLAVWYRDCVHCWAGPSRIRSSLNGEKAPGNCGLLLENRSGPDYSSGSLTFVDWDVANAPEHGIRLGGKYALSNIQLVRPVVHECGSSGIKIFAGPSIFHRDCLVDRPTVYDVGTSDSENECGLLLQNVSRSLIREPKVFAMNREHCGRHGIRISGCDHLHILNPMIEQALVDGIRIDNNLSATPPDEIYMAHLTIQGGSIIRCGGHGIHVFYDGIKGDRLLRFLRLTGFPFVQGCAGSGIVFDRGDSGEQRGCSLTGEIIDSGQPQVVANKEVPGSFKVRSRLGELPALADGSILQVEGEFVLIRKNGNWNLV
jgi:hypothetical protein